METDAPNSPPGVWKGLESVLANQVGLVKTYTAPVLLVVPFSSGAPTTTVLP